MNSASVDLIYLDPPFNSKRTYSAPVGSKSAGASFKDMWTWQDVDEAYLERMVDDYPYLVQFVEAIGSIHGKAMMSYVTYMIQRVIEMHRILKDTGSLYLHCDQTASHYLKITLDRIFGNNGFQNEVIWGYRTGGVSKKWFGRKHDSILFYTKSPKRIHTFNILKERSFSTKNIPPGFKGIEKHKDEFGRWYTMASMRDIWEINAIGRSSKERLGYPTQKPLELLRRIIEASSNKGDVVLDPFAGCATTCVAAQQLQRKWIGIDIEAKAAELVVQRLSDDSGLFKDFIHRTSVLQRTDIKVESADSKNVKERLFKVQEGKCNGCQIEMDARHFEVDHVIPRAKGGGDYYENYQLLCGNCNRIKGDRPMEYLRAKIAKRKEHMKHKITFGM